MDYKIQNITYQKMRKNEIKSSLQISLRLYYFDKTLKIFSLKVFSIFFLFLLWFYLLWILLTLAGYEELKFFVVPDKEYSNGDIPRYPLVLITLNTDFLENSENRLFFPWNFCYSLTLSVNINVSRVVWLKVKKLILILWNSLWVALIPKFASCK